MKKNNQNLISFLIKLYRSQSIAKTLLVWIVFFSAIITLTLTLIQLLIDYKVEIETLDSRLSEIETSYRRSIQASLWNVDIEQLTIQMEGIKRLPDIQSVIVEELGGGQNSIHLQKRRKDSRTSFS